MSYTIILKTASMIRTPYLYPDGDNIDLFCEIKCGALIVSDFAETTGWLRMQSISSHRSSFKRCEEAGTLIYIYSNRHERSANVEAPIVKIVFC